ncbi:hypothetical protein EFB08_06600 [Rufibacter latericius]|uniref:Uncharacterized protein n=2 Tax=Rufibacter latericius TaxID=2487040 RepID=A0A3M9MUB1_9BACT|nr:hypothetical protein EFB08_06600 [Rufibacter latericius]
MTKPFIHLKKQNMPLTRTAQHHLQHQVNITPDLASFVFNPPPPATSPLLGLLQLNLKLV